MKVLIVDDSAIIRKILLKSFEQIDIELEVVGEAENGKRALEVFRETSPDLVTMDITMPEMDGLECLTEILREKPDAKVLIITALKDQATALKALKLGAKGFIQKPFDANALTAEFKKII